MTTFVVVGVGVILLMFLALASQGAPPAEREEEEAPARPPALTLHERVERLIGLLNYGDARAVQEATRQLLSMGNGVVPALLAQLLRLEQRPGALSARCQLRLEELLADFGLQTWLQTAESLRAIHRASPVLPAMTRVLARIGSNLLVELARGPQVDTVGLAAPLMLRLGAQIEDPLRDLLRARPEQLPEALLQAALPALARDPALLDRLLGALAPEGQRALLGALAPWPLPGREARLARLRQAPDPRLARLLCEEALVLAPDAAALLEALGELWRLPEVEPGARVAPLALLAPEAARAFLGARAEPEAAALAARLRDARVEEALAALDDPDEATRLGAALALAARWEDPRAAERLVALASDGADARGAVALAALCRERHEALEVALIERLRSAEDRALGRLALRCVAARAPEAAILPLLRALRAESPRIAALAALALAPRALPTAALLKALGRHRYSPCEPLVAPLLWASWPERFAEIERCLEDPDREINQAAVALLGALGEPAAAPALLKALATQQEDPELILNALELLGAPARAGLHAFAQTQPEFSRRFALARRVQLLEQLDQEPS